MLRISVLLADRHFHESKLDGVLYGRVAVCHMAGMRSLSSGETGKHEPEPGILRTNSGTDTWQQRVSDTRDKTTIPRGRSLSPLGPVRHASGHIVRCFQDGDAEPGIHTMEVAGILWHYDAAMVLCHDDWLPQEPHPCCTDDIAGLAATVVRRKAQPY